MSRLMVQTTRFSVLVVALLVIGAAAPGALAQPGDTGGGTIYFINGATPEFPTNYMWSMDSDGSNVTPLGGWGLFAVPSRDLHNGYRWYLTVRTIPGEYYNTDDPNDPNRTPRSEIFAYREDWDPGNSDTKVQLTNDATLQPFFPWHRFVEWAPGDRTISFMARRWEEFTPEDPPPTPFEGGLYTADLVYSADGNIIGLAALPTDPTLEFPLDADGMPILGTHCWDDTGTRVVYNDDWSTGSTGLWVADLSSGTRTQIFWGLARDPDWSPDGTKIAMTRVQSIYTIRPNGTGLTEIISPTYVGGAWCDCFGKPYFSPTGSHIVCIGVAEDNGTWNNELFRATYRGRYLTNLTESWLINEYPLGWREEAPPPPPPGITVTPVEGLVTTEEGGTDTFSVVLDTQPTADVIIDLSSSDPSEGTVSPASLIFIAEDWDLPQTVTVTGVDDAIVDGNIPYTIVTAPAVSADSDYNGLDAADVSVTNLDDDGAGVTVSSIWPDWMSAGTTIDVSITGTGFQAGATVTFENGSGPAPTADVTYVWPDGLTIEATVTAPGGGPPGERVWDVRVTNPDTSTGVLIDGFTVTR
jgi:hypothetical protein